MADEPNIVDPDQLAVLAKKIGRRLKKNPALTVGELAALEKVSTASIERILNDFTPAGADQGTGAGGGWVK